MPTLKHTCWITCETIPNKVSWFEKTFEEKNPKPNISLRLLDLCIILRVRAKQIG